MIRRFVTTVVLTLGMAWNCQASIQTITVNGTINSGSFGSINVGDSFQVQYSFDTSVGARALSDSNFAVFDALTSLQVTVGTFTASSSGAPEIQVDNDPGGGFFDRYAVVSRASDGLTGPAIGGTTVSFAGFRLDDSSNTVFSDALQLPVSLDLSSFDSNAFFMFFKDVDNSVSGTITSIRNDGGTVVPEPTALAVWVGLACAFCGYRRANRDTL